MNGYKQEKPLLYVGVNSEKRPGYFIPLQKWMIVNGNMRVTSVNWSKLEFSYNYKKRERHGKKPLSLPMTAIKSIERYSYNLHVTFSYKQFDKSFKRWSTIQQETYDVDIYDYSHEFTMKHRTYKKVCTKREPYCEIRDIF